MKLDTPPLELAQEWEPDKSGLFIAPRRKVRGSATAAPALVWRVRAGVAAGVHFSMFPPVMQVDLVRQSVQVLRGFLAV